MQNAASSIGKMAHESKGGIKRIEKGSGLLGSRFVQDPQWGQKQLCVKTGGSELTKNITFQDAKVRKPPIAVSGCTRKGNMGLFDGQGSFILPVGCCEAEKLRKFTRQIKGKIGPEED